MSAGFGKLSDLKMSSLTCGSKIVIDRNLNACFNDLSLRGDASVQGDFLIEGNIMMNGSPIVPSVITTGLMSIFQPSNHGSKPTNLTFTPTDENKNSFKSIPLPPPERSQTTLNQQWFPGPSGTIQNVHHDSDLFPNSLFINTYTMESGISTLFEVSNDINEFSTSLTDQMATIYDEDTNSWLALCTSSGGDNELRRLVSPGNNTTFFPTSGGPQGSVYAMVKKGDRIIAAHTSIGFGGIFMIWDTNTGATLNSPVAWNGTAIRTGNPILRFPSVIGEFFECFSMTFDSITDRIYMLFGEGKSVQFGAWALFEDVLANPATFTITLLERECPDLNTLAFVWVHTAQ